MHPRFSSLYFCFEHCPCYPVFIYRLSHSSNESFKCVIDLDVKCWANFIHQFPKPEISSDIEDAAGLYILCLSALFER